MPAKLWCQGLQIEGTQNFWRHLAPFLFFQFPWVSSESLAPPKANLHRWVAAGRRITVGHADSQLGGIGIVGLGPSIASGGRQPLPLVIACGGDRGRHQYTAHVGSRLSFVGIEEVHHVYFTNGTSTPTIDQGYSQAVARLLMIFGMNSPGWFGWKTCKNMSRHKTTAGLEKACFYKLSKCQKKGLSFNNSSSKSSRSNSRSNSSIISSTSSNSHYQIHNHNENDDDNQDDDDHHQDDITISIKTTTRMLTTTTIRTTTASTATSTTYTYYDTSTTIHFAATATNTLKQLVLACMSTSIIIWPMLAHKWTDTKAHKGGQSPMGSKWRERKGDKQDQGKHIRQSRQFQEVFYSPWQPKPEHGLQSIPGRSFIGICWAVVEGWQALWRPTGKSPGKRKLESQKCHNKQASLWCFLW